MPKMIDFASGGRWPRLLDPHLKQLGDSSRVPGAQLQYTGAAEWSNKKNSFGQWWTPDTLMGGPMLGLEGKNWPPCGGWEVKSTALWEVPTVIDVMGGTSHTSGINHLRRPPLGWPEVNDSK
ncbi:hypothetical protein C8R44DRAFT_745972 [Mycena epipterygia]|nr:hypothetical protein C8R44DRAFT_745972 [Mycena epipterygia]